MPLSLDGTTGISASGNITGGNVIASGALIVGSFSPASVSTAGNVTGGNVLTSGLISATGTITSATNISLTGNIVDASELWINTAANGNINLNVNGTGQTNIPTGILSVTGNIQGGNLRTAGLISATGAITGAAITGTSLTVSTGNVSCGNIVNTNANGVGNIGSSSLYFNTVFAKATSAQYADLAEMYLGDGPLHAGTVVEFGGDQEITICSVNHSPKVAGIISTRPSHLMNATLTGDHAYPVALTGRVPCTVIGQISKGDCLVSSDHPGAAQRLDPEKFVPGCIVGKALQDHNNDSIGTIEVAVGRF